MIYKTYNWFTIIPVNEMDYIEHLLFKSDVPY